ncbi:MAG: hypothetical protein HY235_15345 [Acidobacteria bacterium]|nr:hypothetical protein [Acidobacteriota bacterium]
MGIIVMVAAEKMEFEGLRNRWTPAGRLDWPVEFSAVHSWNKQRVALVANGPGPKLAAAAVQAAFDREQVDAVISTGFCGGLEPALALGDVVVATEVRSALSAERFPAQAPAKAPSAFHGPVLSIDRVATSAEEKRRLFDSGACAVEMEAAGVAGAASQAGVPFYCIRVVSDPADESLPLDFNACRTPEGRLGRAAIARAAFTRPLTRVPALLRFERNCRLAAARLGEFLDGCRF